MRYVLKIRKRGINSLNTLAKFGENNKTFFDEFCAFLLAFTPIFQHYKGPIYNLAISTLIVVFCYFFMKLIVVIQYRKISFYELLPVIPWVLFSIYKVIAHGTAFVEFMEYFILIVVYIAGAAGCINVKHLITCASKIAIGASICLVVQYICFYLMGFHLTLVPVSLLLPSSSQWIGGAMTGLISITGRRGNLYRPSAFFLEPSHYFLYCFPIMFLLLFSPDRSKKKLRWAMLISLGMVLSTSGMGIAVTAGAWGLYFATTGKKEYKLSNILRPRNIFLIAVILVVFIIAYYNVPFLNQAVNRIFYANKGGSTAISGRTEKGTALIRGMRGLTLVFGNSDSTSGISYNLSGFVATMYKYGIIGTVLSYSFYLQGMFRLKGCFFWINVVIVVVSFFSAHTHSIFIGVFYLLIILEGFNEVSRKNFN